MTRRHGPAGRSSQPARADDTPAPPPAEAARRQPDRASSEAKAAIEASLAAAEPTGARPFGELLDRLDAEGLLAGLWLPAGLSRDEARARPLAGVRYDSRRVAPGDAFVAIPGLRRDGHQFLGQVAAAGASAAVVERPDSGVGLPQAVVSAARPALAAAAAWWYGDPSHDLLVVGITGTDGKTTTSLLAAAALEEAGVPTGLTGTIETRIGGTRWAHAEHVTTPEAPELQAALRAMVDAGDRAAIVETTSHGLALDRVANVAYDVAIFTNLTHEHLELHGSFEAYRSAKLRLFEGLSGSPARGAPALAVDRGRRTQLDRGALRDRGQASPAGGPPSPIGIVNLDDPSATWFIDATRRSGAALLTYGRSPSADIRATDLADEPDHLRVRVETNVWQGEIALRLAGRFNAWNALAVVALGQALGLDPEAVRRGLETIPGVPGRMERIVAGQPFTVIVDFAHSPAALAKVLDELVPVAEASGGSCIAVFGSAGERDVAKRAVMGRTAGERCRVVVVTDEDPRGEDRDAILEEIASGAEAVGMRRGESLLLVPDRYQAIGTAFAAAQPGDVVLLAGKGHEQTIEYADHVKAWDEAEEARRALAAMGYREQETDSATR